MAKSYFERTLAWGAKDAERRARRRAQQERRDREREERKAEHAQQVGPRYLQGRNDDVTVKVRAGYSRDLQTPTSDFIVAPHGADGHVHHVLDEWGNVIYDEWNDNHG